MFLVDSGFVQILDLINVTHISHARLGCHSKLYTQCSMCQFCAIYIAQVKWVTGIGYTM